MRKKLIAVVGSGSEIDAAMQLKAKRVGELIAENGFALITGGLGGVMGAASAGAKNKGGIVIGILPGQSANDANPHVDIPIATGLREARNAVIATAADAVIAVCGEYGTLSEIALALKMGKPVVALNSQWERIVGIVRADTPEEAVGYVRTILG